MVVSRVANEYGYADLDRDFRDLEDFLSSLGSKSPEDKAPGESLQLGFV